MLFDLRGAGRRNTVKVVYVLLALLMGGGLILFGIGGSVSGGLVDAITNSGGSSPTDTGTYQRRAQQAQQKAEAHPKDAAAWAEAARARYQLAQSGDFFDQASGQFSNAGKAQLQIVAQDWERHLALAPKHPDDSVAGLMVQVYGPSGLNEPVKAVSAQEIVTEARPKSRTFANLAVLAYQAGQTRKGDLATQKALDLADPADRETLKSELEAAKKSAGATAAPSTPTATPTPAAKKKKKSAK